MPQAADLDPGLRPALLALVEPGDVSHRGADDGDHAGLHDLGPRGLDRLGQAIQPVAAHDQGALEAVVAQLGQHAAPEPTLSGGDPDPQDVLVAAGVDADDRVRGLVIDRPRP